MRLGVRFGGRVANVSVLVLRIKSGLKSAVPHGVTVLFAVDG